jgi:hypothetical protein
MSKWATLFDELSRSHDTVDTTRHCETVGQEAADLAVSRDGAFPEPGGQVIAPARWAGLAADELPFDEPCPERRGLIERRGALFVHFCVECGRWGAYGRGIGRDRPGRWYCRLHRPE